MCHCQCHVSVTTKFEKLKYRNSSTLLTQWVGGTLKRVLRATVYAQFCTRGKEDFTVIDFIQDMFM